MAESTTVITEIATIQEAIQIANEIERHEGALQQMKDMLKTFVLKVGLPVDTGEKTWDFATSESWSFSPENLKALASEIVLMGQNPWEYLDLGGRAITKLNLTPETLVQYGTKKTSNRFGSRKSTSDMSTAAKPDKIA